MNSPEKKSEAFSRSLVFAIGSGVTILLCGLVVLCVPPKPTVIADDALPQSVPTSEIASAPEQQQQQPATGPAEFRRGSTGERLYARFCASCHGADGRAQTNMARMMNPAPTNFVAGPWRAGQTKAEIIDIIKNGRGGMPGYGKEINSEAELDLLAEQVLSFARSGKSPGKEK